METKSLLIGITSFIAGGLLVSIAAVTFEKDQATPTNSHSGMSMMQMADNLDGKSGDEFDKAFIEGMIVHHEGAVAMAKKAESQAKHDEVKTLSRAIISAQETEISQMKQWQKDWGYSSGDNSQMQGMNH